MEKIEDKKVSPDQGSEPLLDAQKVKNALEVDLLTARAIMSIVHQDDKVADAVVEHLQEKMKDHTVTRKRIQTDCSIAGSLLYSIKESQKLMTDILDYTLGVRQNIIDQRNREKQNQS